MSFDSKRAFAGQFLPWDSPEALRTLQERLEGRQISRYDYALVGTDWGIGLTLTDGWRWLFWSWKETDWASALKWRIVRRAIPSQKIWSPSVVATFSRGREQNRRKPEEPADWMQQHVEGEVIVGVAPGELSHERGEVMDVGLRGGSILRWLAGGPTDKRDSSCLADDFIPPPERTVFLAGERPSGPDGGSLIIRP